MNAMGARRPVYRWKSFWLGLFVALFLAWAWWDSMAYQAGFGVNRGGEKVVVFRQEGATYFVRGLEVVGGYWHLPRRVRSWQLEEYFRSQAGRAGFVKVRDAVVLGSFVLLWVGWLVWHGRREKCRVIGERAPER